MQHVLKQTYNLNINGGNLAMQQNPPPFKRFARERFDGASIHGQRPVPPGERHQSSPRISLSDAQHDGRQNQAQSRPNIERCFSYQSTLPTQIPEPASDRFQSRGQPQDFNVVSPVAADDTVSWRLRIAGETQHPSSTVRQRRQHVTLRSDDRPRLSGTRPLTQDAPPHHLQLSPYTLAGDHVPRSVSQPNTPSFQPHLQQRHMDELAPLDTISRSPTLPGDSIRRVRSETRTGEPNFTDEEFHLFVQATAGLGPDDVASSSEDTRVRTGYVPRSDSSMISPEQETPTTTWALHQSAQMPYGTHVPYQQEVMASRPSIQRLETSSSLDRWLQQPSAMSSDDEHNVSPIEDELPDYASSQAQAQAAQRVEAARRAQELQRRWRESHP